MPSIKDIAANACNVLAPQFKDKIMQGLEAFAGKDFLNQEAPEGFDKQLNDGVDQMKKMQDDMYSEQDPKKKKEKEDGIMAFIIQLLALLLKLLTGMSLSKPKDTQAQDTQAYQVTEGLAAGPEQQKPVTIAKEETKNDVWKDICNAYKQSFGKQPDDSGRLTFQSDEQAESFFQEQAAGGKEFLVAKVGEDGKVTSDSNHIFSCGDGGIYKGKLEDIAGQLKAKMDAAQTEGKEQNPQTLAGLTKIDGIIAKNLSQKEEGVPMTPAKDVQAPGSSPKPTTK